VTRKSFTALASLVVLTAQIAQANATTRTYFTPNLDGDRISACIGQGTICGKPVADRPCAGHGFSQALTYRLDRTNEAQARMRTIENKLIETASAQPSIVFVKCYSPNA
jgi:hypothetical protein